MNAETNANAEKKEINTNVEWPSVISEVYNLIKKLLEPHPSSRVFISSKEDTNVHGGIEYVFNLSIYDQESVLVWSALLGFVDKDTNIRFSSHDEVIRHVDYLLDKGRMKPLARVKPEPGTMLSPGDYLIELGSVEAPIAQDDLLVALAMIGFGEVRVDESIKPTDAELKASPWLLWSDGEEAVVSRHRFVGRLEESVQLVQTPRLRWLYVQGLSFEPKDGISEIRPRPLKRNQLYEARILSRAPQVKTGEERRRHREVVFEQLSTMAKEHGGFQVQKLSCLKKHIRLKDQSGADNTMWYALLRWNGPDTYVTSEDPVHFEDLVPVTDPSLENLT